MIDDVSQRSSTSKGAYPKNYCQKISKLIDVSPRSSTSIKLDPILLKHFLMVLKAKSKRKGRDKKARH